MILPFYYTSQKTQFQTRSRMLIWLHKTSECEHIEHSIRTSIINLLITTHDGKIRFSQGFE